MIWGTLILRNHQFNQCSERCGKPIHPKASGLTPIHPLPQPLIAIKHIHNLSSSLLEVAVPQLNNSNWWFGGGDPHGFGDLPMDHADDHLVLCLKPRRDPHTTPAYIPACQTKNGAHRSSQPSSRRETALSRGHRSGIQPVISHNFIWLVVVSHPQNMLVVSDHAKSWGKLEHVNQTNQ